MITLDTIECIVRLRALCEMTLLGSLKDTEKKTKIIENLEDSLLALSKELKNRIGEVPEVVVSS